MTAEAARLPPGWRWATVGNLSERVSVGYVSSTRPFFCPPGEGVPLVRSQNIRPGRLVLDDVAWVTRAFHAANVKSQLRPGDVLFTRVGANVGDVCIVPEGIGDMHLSSAVFARPQPAHRKYIELFFRSPLGQNLLKSRIVGSVSERINTRDVEAVSVLLPPPAEEAAIVGILGPTDHKIELARTTNETLESIARAIFKSWFVDFDPVNAKAEARDPGLPPHLADLFPDSFEDSEFGQVPTGWQVGRFGAVVAQHRGQENPLLSPDALFHHFSIPAFDEGQSPRPEYGESIKSVKWRVPAGVILLSKLNPEIERVWMVDVDPGDRAICSTEFLVLRALPPYTRTYAYCLARSPLFRQQIEGLVTGTSKSHQRAPVESILNLTVVIPPSPIVAAFAQFADPMLERTLACRRESRALTALRDALLPKLISGEVSARGVQRWPVETSR